MSATGKYSVKTVLLGLLVIPLLNSVVGLFPANFDNAAAMAIGAAVLTLGLNGLIWYSRGRRTDRPDSWGRALWPVAAPPLYFALLWVVAFGITGLMYGDTLTGFAWPAAPYLILSLGALLTGAFALVPVIVLSGLVGSVGGFVLGCHRSQRPTGRKALAVIAGASILVAGVGVVQMVQAQMNAAQLVGEASMSDEVDLSLYQPFSESSRLAVPDTTPSLQLASGHPKLDGATALYPVYAAIAQAVYQPPEGTITDDFAWEYVPCNSTTSAYQRLIEGEVDAIFVAQPSKGQLTRAKESGVELALTPIGREAFVFFVNADNPVQNLTIAQVQDIYSKRVTNWKQVGGPDEPILAFQRPEDSGSQTAMLALVMKDRAIAAPLKEESASSMGGIITQVAGYRNTTAAIGYSFRWYATEMNPNAGIRLLSIEGVAPTAENIRNGSYPLIGELNIVSAGSKNPNLQKLIDWTLSAEGQALIEKTGYVGR